MSWPPGTEAAFQVKAGSPRPALHRVDRRGWIEGSWSEPENDRRTEDHHLAAVGRLQLGLRLRSRALPNLISTL